jgi:hypothetical protein
VYFATDEGAPNWIEFPTPSAPVLFRSTFTSFGTGPGNFEYEYGTEFSSATGRTPLEFFMPAIPEPLNAWLLLAGLAVLAVRARRRT